MAEVTISIKKTSPTKTFEDLERWYKSWWDNTTETRVNAEVCDDFYHNKQWTDEQIKEIKKRGQPPVTYNQLAPKINTVIGQEIATRVDPVAKPRTPVHQGENKVATDALRYVADKENTNKDDLKTLMAMDCAVPGWGGTIWTTKVTGKIKEGENGEKVDEREVELVCEHVLWDRLFWDPHSRRNDFQDAKYLGLAVWWDMADALVQYPGAEDVLSQARGIQREQGEPNPDSPEVVWFDTERNRVKVVEIYWRETTKGGPPVWYTAKFALGGFVEPPSKCVYQKPNGDHWCPLQMQSTYCTRHGDRYGLVLALLDPQREINFRRSKALHAMNTKLVLAERSAVKNVNQARAQLHKNDGWLVVENDALARGAIEVVPNDGVTNGNLQLLQEAKEMISSLAPGATQVLASAGISGRASLNASAEANLELKPFMDSLAKWEIRWTRGAWCCVVQYWTYAKWLRVEDSKATDGYRFVGINQVQTRKRRLQELVEQEVPIDAALPMVLDREKAAQILQTAQQQDQQAAQQYQALAQQAQQEGIPPERLPPQPEPGAALAVILQQTTEMEEMMKSGDVAGLDIDIVLSVAPNSAVVEDEQYQALVGLHREQIQAGREGFPLDVIVEASSLRDKGKLLELLRKPPDPEQQQLAQQQQQMQQAQQQLQLETMKAQLETVRAQIELMTAKTQQTAADTQIAVTKAPAEVTKLQSEAEENQANAMHSAAKAGDVVGSEPA